MDLGIKGKTALVTSGGGGIGSETARLLLEEGVTVVLSDLDQEKLDIAAHKLQAREGKLFAFAADVCDVDWVARLRERIEAAVGDIDILIPSSGITGAQGLFHDCSTRSTTTAGSPGSTSTCWARSGSPGPGVD